MPLVSGVQRKRLQMEYMTEVVFKFANGLQISSAAQRVNHRMNRVLEAWLY